MKEPKDLGLKLGTKIEVFWTTIKEKLEESILSAEEGVEADKLVLELANKKILQEQKK